MQKGIYSLVFLIEIWRKKKNFEENLKKSSILFLYFLK